VSQIAISAPDFDTPIFSMTIKFFFPKSTIILADKQNELRNILRVVLS
jgi:hypothetical protein